MQNRYSRYLIDAGLDWEVDGNTVSNFYKLFSAFQDLKNELEKEKLKVIKLNTKITEMETDNAAGTKQLKEIAKSQEEFGKYVNEVQLSNEMKYWDESGNRLARNQNKLMKMFKELYGNMIYVSNKKRKRRYDISEIQMSSNNKMYSKFYEEVAQNYMKNSEHKHSYDKHMAIKKSPMSIGLNAKHGMFCTVCHIMLDDPDYETGHIGEVCTAGYRAVTSETTCIDYTALSVGVEAFGENCVMELAGRVWEATKESKVGREKTVLMSPTMRMIFESEFKNMLYKIFPQIEIFYHDKLSPTKKTNNFF